jgi:tRNA(Ile)-lysidine synthase
LLPLLETWNPRLREHLAQTAALALDEEAWWGEELKQVAPELLMEGRPVRGGGRAAGSELAIDVTRLAALPAALQRRLIREAGRRLDAALDFPATEALRRLALEGRAGQKVQPGARIVAERTPRELRLTVGAMPGSGPGSGKDKLGTVPEYKIPIPGEMEAPAFGLRIRVARLEVSGGSGGSGTALPFATLRNWRAGDRVRLRHSGGPRKVKEVLERMRMTGSARAIWPVLECGGRIVWMQGTELEPEAGLTVSAEAFCPAPAMNPE